MEKGRGEEGGLDGGGFIFKWRGTPWGASVLMGRVSKKSLDGGVPLPLTMGNSGGLHPPKK